jgi:hypothetical protein
VSREERAWSRALPYAVARASGRRCEVVVAQGKEEEASGAKNAGLYSQTKVRVQDHDHGLEDAIECYLAKNILDEYSVPRGKSNPRSPP